MEKVEVSIVVPTYNERDTLPLLLERIDRALRGVRFETIIVDDNSPDGTWRLAEELASTRYPWLRVIRRVGVRGLASAVIDGIRAARGTYVVVMDADLQHPPEVITKLLEKAEKGYDVVVASRYTRGGGVEGWSRIRLVISKSAGLLAHLLVPESRATSDPMSGFFLVKRSRIIGCLDKLRPRGYKILLELLARCPGLRVGEVGYVFRERVAGRSKLGFKTMVDYVLQVLELNQFRIFKMALVGLLGMIVLYVANILLKDYIGVSRLLSYAAAIEISILHNFALNSLWTFRGRGAGKPLYRKLVEYHYSVALGAVVNYAAYQVLTHIGLGDLVSTIAGVVAGYLANYLMAEHHVWAVEAPSQKNPGIEEAGSWGEV